jgi:uncharacterized protein RhaS with RHS repeats
MGYDYFGARYYDSRIGRWTTPDPLADKYPGWSLYNYCLNNPLKFIDLKGLAVAAANFSDESNNKNETHTTDKKNKSDQSAEKKNPNEQKATTRVFSFGATFSWVAGFNFNVGVAMDDKTGDSYLFGRWGMSLGFKATVGGGIDVIGQDLESTRADGEGYNVNPKGNTQQLEVSPLPLLGLSAIFSSRNNGTGLLGFGGSFGPGQGVAWSQTWQSYETETKKTNFSSGGGGGW